jgi:hypothetical protein
MTDDRDLHAGYHWGRGRIWRTIHRIIILNFSLEIFYGFYMVFFAAGGVDYPLFRRATETPIEIILRRRLYGIETWIAITGLSLYLAVTEIYPRRRRRAAALAAPMAQGPDVLDSGPAEPQEAEATQGDA